MKNPFRKDHAPVTLEAPVFARCERGTATPTSPIHIRRVGFGEGIMLGGGIPDTALCDSPLRHGWDIAEPVTDEAVTRNATIAQDRPGRICLICANKYLTNNASGSPASSA